SWVRIPLSPPNPAWHRRCQGSGVDATMPVPRAFRLFSARLGAQMEQGGEPKEETVASGAPRWDRAGMGSAYCNLATASAGRDGVVISLGVGQRAGERASAELKSELLHRILLSPRTAAHLHRILGTL